MSKTTDLLKKREELLKLIAKIKQKREALKLQLDEVTTQMENINKELGK